NVAWGPRSARRSVVLSLSQIIAPTLWLQSAELRPSARQNRETGSRTRFQQRTELMAPPATETPPSPVVMMQLLFGKQLTYSLSAVARLGVTDPWMLQRNLSRRSLQKL